MYRSRSQRPFFNINPGDDGVLEDPRKYGQIQNTLSFKGTGLETSSLLLFTKKNIQLNQNSLPFSYSAIGTPVRNAWSGDYRTCISVNAKRCFVFVSIEIADHSGRAV
jgi:hypothetical protein